LTNAKKISLELFSINHHHGHKKPSRQDLTQQDAGLWKRIRMMQIQNSISGDMA